MISSGTCSSRLCDKNFKDLICPKTVINQAPKVLVKLFSYLKIKHMLKLF
jgi:hypothetical protein